MGSDLLREFLDLVGKERQLLLSGEIAGIESIADRKLQLADQIAEADSVDSDLLSELQSRIARNQHLLAHALDGIAAARSRVAEIRAAATGLDTYTSGGTRADMGGAASSVERRA